MKDRCKIGVKSWFTVSALLLLMSIISVGYGQADNLTEAEKYWLIYLREEEKLARDVYLFLYDKRQSRIFKNISVSEQAHMDAIKTLLERYGIPDPAAGKDPGKFSYSGLQDLYEEISI